MHTDAGNSLFSYWHELSRADPVPLQREFKPARVRRHLPDLFILGRNDAGELVFRLAGTRLCAMFGHELRGHPYGCLWDEAQGDQAEAAVETVIATARPALAEVTGLSADGAHRYELLLLPMRSGGETVDRVLGAILPRQPRPSACPEKLSCLHAGATNVLDGQPEQNVAEDSRFSRFMRRLLSVEIVEDGLPGRS